MNDREFRRSCMNTPVTTMVTRHLENAIAYFKKLPLLTPRQAKRLEALEYELNVRLVRAVGKPALEWKVEKGRDIKINVLPGTVFPVFGHHRRK